MSSEKLAKVQEKAGGRERALETCDKMDWPPDACPNCGGPIVYFETLVSEYGDTEPAFRCVNPKRPDCKWRG